MKIMYDPEGDELRILFRDAPIERSAADVPGLIVDYDNDGAVVGLELARASERMNNPRLVEFIEQNWEVEPGQEITPAS